MDPTAQIAIIETDLRRVVQAVLGGTDNSTWIRDVLAPGTVDDLNSRRKEEMERRAPAGVPQSLLAYTHFYELRKIIEKNWEKFAPVLGAKKEFVVLADIVEDYRNAPAHSRELLPHEVAMLQGIAGTIRTQVTVFLSTTSPDRKHYPIIEAARDSFGNEMSESISFDNDAIVSTGLRLNIGDEVSFDLRGWDPQGRELTWTMEMYPHQPGNRSDGICWKGTEVVLHWTACEEHVAAHTMVQISVQSSGSYHRYQGYDARVTFNYAVDPPDPVG